MSTTFSISARQAYGIARVCRVWGVSRASYYRRTGPAPEAANQSMRRGPVGAMPDGDLVSQIAQLIEDSPFHGEGYRKMWARLRHKRVFTSQERVRRLMREHNLSACLGQGTPRGSKAHDGTITPQTIDTMWGTDMTTTVTLEEGQAAVFIAYDHCSGECVGIHASRGQNRWEALEPIRQGVKDYFGTARENIAEGLSLRHDHGTQYMAHDFQKEIKWLGITSSPAFVRMPECNGCAERFIRTLKENLLWVRHFKTIEELRLALLKFRQIYNEKWIMHRHKYKTPAQFRRDIIDNRAMAA